MFSSLFNIIFTIIYYQRFSFVFWFYITLNSSKRYDKKSTKGNPLHKLLSIQNSNWFKYYAYAFSLQASHEGVIDNMENISFIGGPCLESWILYFNLFKGQGIPSESLIWNHIYQAVLASHITSLIMMLIHLSSHSRHDKQSGYISTIN